MSRNLILKFGFTSLFFVAGFFFVAPGHASADTWCGLLAPGSPAITSSTTTCPSQNYDTCTVAGPCGSPTDSASLKSTLINNLNAFSSGQYNQRVGASYIINNVIGNSATSPWQDRINNPNVTLSVETYTYSQNTAYSTTTKGVVSYSEADSRLSLVIRYNGVIYSAIKIDCGNPVGSSTPLPSANPTVQGYKIGVDASGNYLGTSGPFADDTVVAGPFGISATGNPFVFSPTASNHLNPGSFYFTYTDAGTPDTGWSYVGYTICAEGNSLTALCDAAMSNPSRATTEPTALEAGVTYDIRLIYQKTNGPTCPSGETGTPPNCCPSGSTGTYPSCQQPSGNCPGDPAINASTLVNVALPDEAPSNPAPSGTSSQPNATQIQDVPDKNTSVTSVQDISSGGSRVTPTQVSQSYQKVTLDYNPYVQTYPYDSNQPSVTYNSYYKETVWTSSSTPDGYNYSCPAGSIPNNGNYQDCVNVANPDPAGSQTCPAGYTYFLGGCFQHVDSISTPYYDWHEGATSEKSVSNTVAGYAMSPCYQRNFTLSWSPDPSNTQSGSLEPSSEDPTSSQFNGSASVAFSGTGPNTALRQPTTVTITSGGQIVSPASVAYASCSGGGIVFSTGGGKVQSTTGAQQLATVSCSPTQAPPLEPGQQVCINMTASGASGQNYSADLTSASSGQISASNVCTQQVTNEPYAQFFGNDVSAGGAFTSGSDQCNNGETVTKGLILANTETLTSGSLVRGSGAQLAGLALGSIGGNGDGFGTASLRTTAPLPYTGLMFSNTNSGNLGTTNCIPDYYGSGGAGSSAWAGPPAANSGPSTYVLSSEANGNYTLGGFVVPLGVSITIYAPGNVEITGPIYYDGANGGWAVNGNNTNVPSLFVIAKGDIYIDPGVSELDGTYVAQGSNKQGGTIDTCYTHDYNSCSQQLTVYGSFIAGEVNLYRTYASLRDSKPGEYPSPLGNQGNCDLGDGGNPTGPGGPRGTNYDCAAEVFIFSPANYLGQPALPAVGGPNSGKFDAISSLSPVL